MRVNMNLELPVRSDKGDTTCKQVSLSVDDAAGRLSNLCSYAWHYIRCALVRMTRMMGGKLPHNLMDAIKITPTEEYANPAVFVLANAALRGLLIRQHEIEKKHLHGIFVRRGFECNHSGGHTSRSDLFSGDALHLFSYRKKSFELM